MKKDMDRRSFIKSGALLGVTAIVSAPKILDAARTPDIAVVEGLDSFAATLKAVKKIGGMKRFVKKNSKVVLLANAQRNNPGAYTHPEIVRAVIRMCREAGAAKIHFLSSLPEANWESTGLKKIITEEQAELIVLGKEENLYRPVAVEKGVALKEAHIMEIFYDYDVFINMPITKDHAGNKFTGTLKNLMGLNWQTNNRTFHKPNWATDPDAIQYLDQCIADLNTVIRPNLCIVDATEIIITNGPFGPGEILAPHKVIAGTDRVAIDAYCCTLWGLDPRQIQTIVLAQKHGIGEINPKKVKIKEFKV
jgi:uncharacterized protein (DUF362 family)